MPVFPSSEWLASLKQVLDTHKPFQEASANWEGDFLFVVEPPNAHSAPSFLYLDLAKGACRSAREVMSETDVSAQFIVKGDYDSWKKVVTKKLDPVAAIMTRKLRLKGDLSKVMANLRAVKELVNATTLVASEFRDG